MKAIIAVLGIFLFAQIIRADESQLSGKEIIALLKGRAAVLADARLEMEYHYLITLNDEYLKVHRAHEIWHKHKGISRKGTAKEAFKGDRAELAGEFDVSLTVDRKGLSLNDGDVVQVFDGTSYTTRQHNVSPRESAVVISDSPRRTSALYHRLFDVGFTSLELGRTSLVTKPSNLISVDDMLSRAIARKNVKIEIDDDGLYVLRLKDENFEGTKGRVVTMRAKLDPRLGFALVESVFARGDLDSEDGPADFSRARYSEFKEVGKGLFLPARIQLEGKTWIRQRFKDEVWKVILSVEPGLADLEALTHYEYDFHATKLELKPATDENFIFPFQLGEQVVDMTKGAKFLRYRYGEDAAKKKEK